MNTRSVALLASLLIGCGPATPAPAPAATPAPAPAPSPSPEPEPPFVYYQMVQPGHVELVVDEVRLDAEGARCFQTNRRMFGGITFDKGQGTLSPDAFADEVQSAVSAWKDWTQRGKKPSLVLHGHASRDEAESPEHAVALSEKRAEEVKARLVAEGIPADRLQVLGHGWAQSPEPMRATQSLQPNRRVEISPDRTPPSQGKRIDAGPVGPEVLGSLQGRIRALEGKAGAAALGLHAPRVVFAVRDASGELELQFDITSADPEAIALHRYFLQGLSNDCVFASP